MVLTKKSPSKPASNQDPSDISPQPRVASGTLPPQAAHAPEFVPGEGPQPSVSSQRTENHQGEQKTSEASSDKEMEPKKTEKRTKAEGEADEQVQREQALDEEWWSGDEIFVPNLKNKNDLLKDQQD